MPENRGLKKGRKFSEFAGVYIGRAGGFLYFSRIPYAFIKRFFMRYIPYIRNDNVLKKYCLFTLDFRLSPFDSFRLNGIVKASLAA